MKPTKQEIETGRERLLYLFRKWLPDVDTIRTSTEFLDALCAAASEPDSLVGQRVRVSSPSTYGSRDGHGTVEDGPHEAWTVEIDDAGSYTINRDDLELLEGK